MMGQNLIKAQRQKFIEIVGNSNCNGQKGTEAKKQDNNIDG